jgi:hypothetical protein
MTYKGTQMKRPSTILISSRGGLALLGGGTAAGAAIAGADRQRGRDLRLLQHPGGQRVARPGAPGRRRHMPGRHHGCPVEQAGPIGLVKPPGPTGIHQAARIQGGHRGHRGSAPGDTGPAGSQSPPGWLGSAGGLDTMIETPCDVGTFLEGSNSPSFFGGWFWLRFNIWLDLHRCREQRLERGSYCGRCPTITTVGARQARPATLVTAADFAPHSSRAFACEDWPFDQTSHYPERNCADE